MRGYIIFQAYWRWSRFIYKLVVNWEKNIVFEIFGFEFWWLLSACLFFFFSSLIWGYWSTLPSFRYHYFLTEEEWVSHKINVRLKLNTKTPHSWKMRMGRGLPIFVSFVIPLYILSIQYMFADLISSLENENLWSY